MIMTNAEIIANYREAKNKRTQIQILADLNACTRENIIEILSKAGETVPITARKAKPKTKDAAKPKETAPTMETPKDEEKLDYIVLAPGEAESLADFLGLALIPAIQNKGWGIENPEYIKDLATIYERCRELALRVGLSECGDTFCSQRRGLNNGEVW